MKVAIVHDWLTGMRGGERVLLEFLRLYPQADIVTLLFVPGSVDEIIEKNVRQCSWLSSIPHIQKIYRHLLPLYPSAIRSIDVRDYDLVI